MKIDVVEAAQRYIEKGYSVLPVKREGKQPLHGNWPSLKICTAEVHKYFSADANVGLILGAVSNGLTDVDLDCVQALALAPHFLPATQLVHGRRSKPSSHYWYLCPAIARGVRFEDPEGACLLEVRSNGQQTVVPPSRNPSGEELRWEHQGDPSVVEPDTLISAAKHLAACTLIARVLAE